MEAVREVTLWDGIDFQPNHTYLLDGDKIIAYIKNGATDVQVLKGAIKIDRRGRKFVKADIKLFNVPKKQSNIIKVKGSKGNVYYVNVDEQTCSCPGFTFRGSCKHVEG